MQSITLMLLAVVLVMAVMMGSTMAHQTHFTAAAAEEEASTTNESDTKLVAAQSRNAAADGASVYSMLWSKVVSGYHWMTMQATDNQDIEFEETRESKGKIFFKLYTIWMFSTLKNVCLNCCRYITRGILFFCVPTMNTSLHKEINWFNYRTQTNDKKC